MILPRWLSELHLHGLAVLGKTYWQPSRECREEEEGGLLAGWYEIR